MTPNEYLDALKAEIAVESDYALAKRLEMAHSRGLSVIPNFWG